MRVDLLVRKRCYNCEHGGESKEDLEDPKNMNWVHCEIKEMDVPETFSCDNHEYDINGELARMRELIEYYENYLTT